MKVVGGCLVGVLLVGCTASTPAPDKPSEVAAPSEDALGSNEPASPTSESDLACPNEAALRRDLAAEPGTEVDLDSDGRPETISVGSDPEGPSGCQAVLVVTGEMFGSLVSPVEGEPSFELGLPALLGTAEVDGAPPQELIVNVASGASTGFAALFSVIDGELVRREVQGDTPYSNLFPYGGSVGHIEGADCAGDGRIVITSALPSGDGYVVERRFFSSSGAAFVFDEDASETSQVATDDLARIAEFGGTPFASCPQ